MRVAELWTKFSLGRSVEIWIPDAPQSGRFNREFSELPIGGRMFGASVDHSRSPQNLGSGGSPLALKRSPRGSLLLLAGSQTIGAYLGSDRCT